MGKRKKKKRKEKKKKKKKRKKKKKKTKKGFERFIRGGPRGEEPDWLQENIRPKTKTEKKMSPELRFHVSVLLPANTCAEYELVFNWKLFRRGPW